MPKEAQDWPFIKSMLKGEVPERWVAPAYDGYISILEMQMRTVISNQMGMWAIVDKTWTKKLADWIGDRTVLEVMAGKGWLAKALSEHGVDILPTDSKEWHKEQEEVFPVVKMDALKAAASYKRDILLVSWPPYTKTKINEVCEVYRGKPIIYIGEGPGGCTANDVFFEHFKPIDEQPDARVPSFDTIHDYLEVGLWL